MTPEPDIEAFRHGESEREIELAKFWDTHDLTEFEAQLEEVTEPIFERESLTPTDR